LFDVCTRLYGSDGSTQQAAVHWTLSSREPSQIRYIATIMCLIVGDLCSLGACALRVVFTQKHSNQDVYICLGLGLYVTYRPMYQWRPEIIYVPAEWMTRSSTQGRRLSDCMSQWGSRRGIPPSKGWALVSHYARPTMTRQWLLGRLV